MAHTTVLLQPSIQGLALKAGDVFLDATINGGGHSELVAQMFGDKVRIIGLDMDAAALEHARARLGKAGAHFDLKESNFRELDKALAAVGADKINAALFDIGLSSNQLEATEGEGRGFSFQKDEPLLMTFKRSPSDEDLTASFILNNWEEEHIADIIRGYGEERFAGRIAHAIAEAREQAAIETTGQLVEIIRQATPAFYHRGKTHYATRTFQALRITVNDELGSLAEGLRKAFEHLAPGGRLAVISFHSLEDRLVKRYFRELAAEDKARLITKKPIVPSIDEVAANRRARSAKLRIIEKIS
jgi:16S rRNA (cytosine1402-N4)-methyltransferase